MRSTRRRKGRRGRRSRPSYKGNKDADAKLYKHLTTGEKAKFDDGHEEDHPIVKSKSPDDIKNLVSWLLSL